MARGSLVDVVDHLLDRGVTLQGDSMVTLAGVDLIYLRLNVLLASAETLRRIEAEGAAAGQAQAMTLATARPATATASVIAFAQPPPLAPASPVEARRTLPPSGGADVPTGILEPPARRMTFSSAEGSPAEGSPLAVAPSPSSADRPSASRSLAQLIVTLAEFLRQIIERQALRRVEGGGLHDNQIEKIGLALADLERSMKELRDTFDIEERDLELDLGPLGQIP